MPKTVILISLAAVLFCIACPKVSSARDLVAGAGNIPPHSLVGEDGRPKGGFVEVIKAIDRVYAEGTIAIRILPLKRAVSDLTNGKLDLVIPYISNPLVPEATLPFIPCTEPVVNVAFVLYTRADKRVFPMDGLNRLHNETLRGAEPHFPFAISGIDSFRQGLLRVSLGRSDGFIAEQDGCDLFIRQHKIQNIRRTLYAKWETAIIIRKGPDRAEIDHIVSTALHKLKQDGELQKITAAIHRPFEDWQPYLTDWPLEK